MLRLLRITAHLLQITLGAERVIPGGPVEDLLRAFKQFILTLPTG